MSASDFRLLTEAQKYGLRTELLNALKGLYDWAEGNVAYGVPEEIAKGLDAVIKKAERT